MAFISSFNGLTLRAPTRTSTSSLRACAGSDADAAKSTPPQVASSRPLDAVEQYFPAATRYLAPHVVFPNRSTIVLDNCVVEAPLAAEVDDPAPDKSLYERHFPKPGDTLNWAPHVGVTGPGGFLSVGMSAVAEGKVSRDGEPDKGLFESFYPNDGRFFAPEISMEEKPGTVGVEMKAVEGVASVADTGFSIDPKKYENAFPNDDTLHMAPCIEISDGVLKCQMRKIWVDVDTIDRPPFEGYPQYESFCGLNRAPVISVDSKDGAYVLGVTMEDMPSFVGVNAAPVIEFMGVGGREGISCKMEMIAGDHEAVDRRSKGEDKSAVHESTYQSSWKPASSLAKAWV